MVFKELEGYDSQIYPYNCYIKELTSGESYVIISTTEILEYTDLEWSHHLRFSPGASYKIFEALDGVNYSLLYENTSNSVTLGNDHSPDVEVQYNIEIVIGEEIETTPTPSPAPGDGGEGGDNTETPGETTQPGETSSPEQTTSPNVDVTVVIGDEVIDSITEIQTANNEIVEAQHITNGLMTTVLFFFIFVWAEKRIKHAVRSFTGRGLNE